MTYAKIILDSVGPQGQRLTTMEVEFHRFVLAEFNTHRLFSRNSASSRAIPVAKQLKRIKEDPAIPLEWPQEQSGMQGGESLDVDQIQHCIDDWLHLRDQAVATAENLMATGVHKSVVNRILEPWMWHRVIVSSSDWQNFYAQRVSPLAQPEIRAVATMMLEAHEKSVPELVGMGEWHLPYITDEDFEECYERDIDPRSVSAARCARVSYLTHDGVRDLSADVTLFERLSTAQPPHASPLEHVATPDSVSHQLSNFTGWNQLRHEYFPRKYEWK